MTVMLYYSCFMDKKRTYNLDELCAAVQMNKRTVRFYIQQGLVNRPLGEKRGAHYNDLHVEQLLTVANLKNDGLSLERIKELMAGEGDKPQSRQIGAIEMWTRIHLGEGVELNIDASRAGLTAGQLQALTKAMVPLIKSIKESDSE